MALTRATTLRRRCRRRRQGRCQQGLCVSSRCPQVHNWLCRHRRESADDRRHDDHDPPARARRHHHRPALPPGLPPGRVARRGLPDAQPDRRRRPDRPPAARRRPRPGGRRAAAGGASRTARCGGPRRFREHSGQAEPASVAMRDAIEGAGIRVVERLVVRDGRWWSLDCDRDCCPAEGEPVQADDEVPAVSDYIVRGRRPAGSRADLAARLAYQPQPEQDRRCAAFIPTSRPHGARGARCSDAGGACSRTGRGSSTSPRPDPTPCRRRRLATTKLGRGRSSPCSTWRCGICSSRGCVRGRSTSRCSRRRCAGWPSPFFRRARRRRARPPQPPGPLGRPRTRSGARRGTRSRRVWSTGWRWSAVRRLPSCRPGRSPCSPMSSGGRATAPWRGPRSTGHWRWTRLPAGGAARADGRRRGPAEGHGVTSLASRPSRGTRPVRGGRRTV